MIRINLLPHREMRRERRKKEFVVRSVLAAAVGGAAAVVVALGIHGQIESQKARNDFITRENQKLDAQIREIAQLKQEIEALRARQEAVESLQQDRTMPVHVLDELVRHTPEGIHLKQLRQVGRKVMLTGLAQSNERVSNLLRSLANDTAWLERPELVEIKAVALGKPDPAKKDQQDLRRAYEFSLGAMVKAPETGEPATPARPVAGAAATVVAAGATR